MADELKLKSGDYIQMDSSLEGEHHSLSPGQVLKVGKDVDPLFALALVTEPEDEPRAHVIDKAEAELIATRQAHAVEEALGSHANEIPPEREERTEPPAGEHTLEAALANGGDPAEDETGGEEGGDGDPDEGGSGDGEADDEGTEEPPAGDEGTEEPPATDGESSFGDGAPQEQTEQSEQSDESEGEEAGEVADDEKRSESEDDSERATAPEAEKRETATQPRSGRGRGRVKPPKDS